MERPGRVELPASWFEARRSVQMSYGREKLVPLVGFEPTRPKALVSETSAATYYATGANIGVSDGIRTRIPALKGRDPYR